MTGKDDFYPPLDDINEDGHVVNAALRAEVNRIALKLKRLDPNTGQANHLRIAREMARRGLHVSSQRLQGIMSAKMQMPDVSTLRRLALHAGESPLRLFAAAGWMTTQDAIQYLQDEGYEVGGRGGDANSEDSDMAHWVEDTQVTARDQGLSDEQATAFARQMKPMIERLVQHAVAKALHGERTPNSAQGHPGQDG